MDTSKAFDCVSHSILLSKLEHYGFDTAWFQDYLKDGEQQVFIGDHKSKKAKLNIGVRQGSILGPIFFLVMIEDLSRISEWMSTLLYADDTTFLGEDESLEMLYKNGQDTADAFFQVENGHIRITQDWDTTGDLVSRHDTHRIITTSG